MKARWVWVERVATVTVLALCMGLRLVPALVLGVPYLPDPWVHMAKAEEILQLGRFNIWGDYADHWPGLNILIALIAMFPGLDTLTIGRLVIPLLCSLSLPLFYLLVRRLTGNPLAALAGLMLLGFAAPLTLIMGCTFKEGLARLLLSLVLFAFVVRPPERPARVLPVVIPLIAMIPVHHFTFLVAGTILLLAVLASQLLSLRAGQLELVPCLFQTIGYLSVFGIALAYYVVFNCFSFILVDPAVLAVGLASYLIVFGALSLRRLLAPRTPTELKLILAGLGLVILLIFFANLALRPTFPLTVLPASTLLMTAPLVATVALGGLGLASIDRLSSQARLFLCSWVFALLALTFFAFFGGHSSLNLILTYRIFNFALAPLCALAGVSLFVYAAAHPRRARMLQAGLAIGLLAVLPVATLAFTRDPFFGYGCSVTPPIQASNQWLAASSSPHDVILGDHLFTYYLHYYLGREAPVEDAILLFVVGEKDTPFAFAATHTYMEQNGFWLPSGVQWAPVRDEILSWLASDGGIALVYNNGVVQIYRRLAV